ncbi:hypothetical protein ACFLTK_01555 [Chloroflexota bacterium]
MSIALTTKVKRLGYKLADYIGIAPVARLKNAPDGHRPTDLLPKAESVISIGIYMTRGAVISAHRKDLSGLDIERASNVYKRFAYTLLNVDFLDTAALQIARLLEKDGHTALPVIAPGFAEIVENRPNMINGPFGPISHRHVAVATGVGELGWNGLVINPVVGPRARYTTVITNAKLEPDPIYHGPKLCEPKKCGFVCANICSAQCLSKVKSNSCVIGGREFHIGKMEHVRCIIYFGLLERQNAGENGEGMPEDGRQLNLSDYQSHFKEPSYKAWESMAYGWGDHGGLCLLKCPVRMPTIVKEYLRKWSRQK